MYGISWLTSLSRNRDYLNWRSEYLNVYNKFIAPYLPSSPLKPVKIAILDTGIDRGHDSFEAREEAIKARLNCYNESQRSIPDLNGHGTFTASLILDYAPDAELCIIKIADLNVRPSATTVAKVSQNTISNSIRTGAQKLIYAGHQSRSRQMGRRYYFNVVRVALV